MDTQTNDELTYFDIVVVGCLTRHPDFLHLHNVDICNNEISKVEQCSGLNLDNRYLFNQLKTPVEDDALCLFCPRQFSANRKEEH